MDARQRQQALRIKRGAAGVTVLLLLALATNPAMAAGPTERAAASTPAVETGYVKTSDGVQLFYQKVGDGSQVVVIPAGLFVFDDFKHLADGRTLIFYDMRNRGRSDRVEDGDRITIQADVQDMEAIRQHFSAERFSTIGYSYLGLMVMLYAMEHPERVERIVQVGAVPLKFGTTYPDHLTMEGQPPPVPEEMLAELRKLREARYDVDHPKEFCEKEWEALRYWLVGDPANVHKVEIDVCRYPNEWPVNFQRHLEHHFVGSVQKLEVPREKVAQVKVPVLTIHGTRDRNAPYGGAREWALLLPNARLVTVKGGAHHVWADDPSVLDAIDAFLSGHWPQRAEKIKEL